MTSATTKILVVLLAALPSVSLAAGKYSWFDDSSADPGAIRARPSAFDTDVYRSLGGADDAAALPQDRISVFGDYGTRAQSTEEAARPFANFGVRWQHRVSVQDQVEVSAQQGETALPQTVSVTPEALDTRATISWRRDLAWSWKPSITGGVFLGDESARDETTRQASRRYYGFTVGGELKLLQAHTPYVSFRMERSLYDLPEGATIGAVSGTGPGSAAMRATDDSSRVAAGWRWQVQRGWSVQAEASYGFNYDTHSSDLLLQDREGSRLFFGTRFDFR